MTLRIPMHVQVVPFEIHRLILYLYVALHRLCVEVRRRRKRLNDSKNRSIDEGDRTFVTWACVAQHLVVVGVSYSQSKCCQVVH